LHKKFPRFQDFLLQNAGESEVEEAIQNSNSDPEATAASQQGDNNLDGVILGLDTGRRNALGRFLSRKGKLPVCYSLRASFMV
jgi:hypothetical protein